MLCTGVSSHMDDEYKWAGVEDPKLMVTTSRDPSSRLKMFAKVSGRAGNLFFLRHRILNWKKKASGYPAGTKLHPRGWRVTTNPHQYVDLPPHNWKAEIKSDISVTVSGGDGLFLSYFEHAIFNYRAQSARVTCCGSRRWSWCFLELSAWTEGTMRSLR